MTNREEGERLVQQARRVLERDGKGAWEDKDYNMAVRRSQEVVEMALKGALRFLGADYPKIHDVGFAFALQVRNKAPQVAGEVLERIEQISAWLAEARTPSFYLEREYGEGDARRAIEDASYVVEVIEKLFA